MVCGIGATFITFRAVLDLISPRRQYDMQDDILKDAQDSEQGAARARRMAKTREDAVLRKASGGRGSMPLCWKMHSNTKYAIT